MPHGKLKIKPKFPYQRNFKDDSLKLREVRILPVARQKIIGLLLKR
jgi:hypothetical protein